jgi:hypothetical protein
MSVYRRGATYWVRFRIPADLRPNSAPKNSILRISLRTTSRSEALLRSARVKVRLAEEVRAMRHGALAAAVDAGDRLDAYLRAKAELEVLSEQAYGDIDSTSMSHPPIGNFIRLKAAQDSLDAILRDSSTSSEPVRAPSVAVSPISVTNPPKPPVAPTPIVVDLPSTCIAAPNRLKAHANDDGAGCAHDETPTEIVSTPCDAIPTVETARSSVLDVAPCEALDADPESTISVVTDPSPLPRSKTTETLIPAMATKTVDGLAPPPMPSEQISAAGLVLVMSTHPTSRPAFDIDERYDDLEPDSVLPWHSFIERFFKSRVFADKTVTEYRRAYGVLIGIAPDFPFNEVRRRHMRTFIREVAALPGRKGRETASAQTQDKYLSAVKSIFSWAEDEGLCVEDHDPFGSIGPDNRNEDAGRVPGRGVGTERGARSEAPG